MGSLSSTPKVPKRQVVFVPAPTNTITPIVSAGTVSSTATDTKELASNERKKSLLARSRSRFGTIATSLQGILGERTRNGGRKTLLGE